MPSFTRKAIMESFVKLLDERPLSKISVKNIVDDCGVTRNTFYYHFQDIPDLIEAIVKAETDLIISEHGDVNSIEECLNIAVQFILKHRRVMMHVYNSASREIFERYLMQLCQYVVDNYIKTAFGDVRITEDDREVIVTAYQCECFGLMINWLNGGLRDGVEPRIMRLCELRKGMIEEMVRQCAEDAQKDGF